MRTLFLPTHARAVALLMVIALMTTIATPIAAQIGDDVPPPEVAEDPVVPTEPPAEPTAEPALPPTEPVAEQPEPTEAVAPPAEEPAMQPTVAAAPETHDLVITVYRCDHLSVDPYASSTIDQVLDQCTDAGFGMFTIGSSIPVPPQSGQSLQFEVGTVDTIQDQVASGYDDPIADCSILDDRGNVLSRIGPGRAPGGLFKVDGGNHDVHCDWYQVDRGIGNVYLVNMACPSTAGLVPEPSMTELVTMCTESAGAITFGIQYGEVFSRVLTSGGEFNDVFFEAIPTGPIEFWAETHGAFASARVFCQVNTLDGAEVRPFAEVAIANYRATGITLGHGQQVHCSWFNIAQAPGLAPADQPTATAPPDPLPTEATVDTGPGDLIIAKHTCPANYNPETPNADPLTDCTPGPNGVTFTLSDDDPGTFDLQTMTGDSIANAVSFGSTPPGAYTVTETVPAGTALIFVMGCGDGSDPIVTVVNGSLQIQVPAGMLLTCHWFNVPAAGNQAATPLGTPEPSPGAIAAQVPTNRLTISTFRCDATYWIQNPFTHEALISRCPEPGTAAFTVESDFGTENASGTSFAFHVLGDLTITETMQQAGFGDPIVYCDVYGPDGTVAYRRGPIEPYLGEYHYGTVANDIHCDWYQIDRSEAKLTIVNMACPSSAALAPTPTMDELVTMCTDPAGPVSFYVSDNNFYYESSTSGGEFNQAYFGDVPYDRELTIAAEPPATFASARVFCQFDREDQFHDMGVTDFRFTTVFRRVEQIHCNWFNIAQSPGLSQADNEPTVVPTPPTQSPGLSQGDDDPAIVPTATSQPGGPGLSQGNNTPAPVDPTQPTPTPGPGLSNGTTPVPTTTVPPQPSNLIVSVYSCAASYAPEATTAHPFTDCVPGPAGVTFTLTDSDPATVDPQSMTGDVIPNAIQFGGLVPGNYTITETLSPGPASTFVLGCGGSGTSPVLTVVPGSHIIQVPAATLLTCYWFNIPPPV